MQHRKYVVRQKKMQRKWPNSFTILHLGDYMKQNQELHQTSHLSRLIFPPPLGWKYFSFQKLLYKHLLVNLPHMSENHVLYKDLPLQMRSLHHGPLSTTNFISMKSRSFLPFFIISTLLTN